MPSMKILLIAGGWSSEREVSLTGARGMQEALLKRGHAVTFFCLLENFYYLLEYFENIQLHYLLGSVYLRILACFSPLLSQYGQFA